MPVSLRPLADTDVDTLFEGERDAAAGSRHLGFTEALCSDMPVALERGATSEWRATLVVRETAVLSRADRRAVEAELALRQASHPAWPTSSEPETAASAAPPAGAAQPDPTA